MTNPIGNGPRVDRTGASAASTSKSADPRGSAGASDARGGTAAEATPVHSDRLQAVRAAIDGAPAVDHGRVDEIRERIARGEYPLNPDRIAQRFVEFEKLLHG